MHPDKMSDADPTPEDWARREALLDRLLDLTDDDQRTTLLAEIERDNAEDAHSLRRWLSGIEGSAGKWAPLDRPESAPHEQEVVGNWRALHLLGRGGMGEVWLGERADGLFDKKVAIKFIRDDRPALRAGIESERRLLANLRHPGIVPLLDAGTTDAGTPYLVTDFIDGTRLDVWLDQAPLDLTARITLFQQVADAVAHAHEQLIVHGDIKPTNILVDSGGRTHLLDFGIARVISRETPDQEHSLADTLFTPEYAAPELVAGAVPSVRSDIHALGGLLYFLLHGRPPRDFDGLQMSQVLDRIRTGQELPAKEAIPTALAKDASSRWYLDLEAIAAKAMAHEPAGRYGTIEALLRDVDAARLHLPVSARPATRTDRVRRALYRNRKAAVVSALIVGLLIAGLVGTSWQARRAAQQRDIAELQATRAEAEARNANAVRDFMVGVFAAANPEQNLGDMPTALELVDAGARRIDNELKGQPALQAEFYGALGDTYAGLGQYPQAVSILKKALTTARRTSGDDALLTRKLLVQYARTRSLQGSGPYDDVLAMLQQTLARPVTATPESRAVDAETHAQYGGLLHRTGELDKASRVLAEAATRARALGADGEEALAIVLHQQAQLDEARGKRDRAITALRELDVLLTRSPQHSVGDRQLVRQELASLLGEVGKGDEAEALLRQVMLANEKVYGPSHPFTITSKVNYARALTRHGKPEEARLLSAEMVDISHKQHGEDAEVSIFALTNLASIEYGDKRYDKAIALLERARRPIVQRDGENGPRSLLMLQNIARIRLDAGDFAGAERDLEQLLSALRSINSDATAEPLALLGDIARQQGDPGRARTLHQQALDIYEAAGDTTSFDIQDHRLALALDERDLGNMSAARKQAQAGLQGLLKLDAEANAGMIDYARYVLWQFDVLEQRCNAQTRQRMTEFAARQRSEFGAAAIDGLAAWRYARIELYLGLCGRQVAPDDVVASHLATDAAKRIIAAPEADPHTRRLARDTLRKSTD